MATRNTQKPAKKSTVAELDGILEKHGFEFCDKQCTVNDLVKLIKDIGKHSGALEASKGLFSGYMTSFAATCSTAEEFLTVCGKVEARNGWKSKQNPGGKDKAPGVWTQAKSNIYTGWDKFKLIPKQDYDSTGKLNQLLQEKRKEAKDKEKSASGEKQANQAIQSAAQVDQGFGNLLARIGKLYEEMDDDNRKALFESLAEVYNAASNTDSDIASLMQDIAKGEQGAEVKQAQQH